MTFFNEEKYQSTTISNKGGLNCYPKRVEIMNSYLTTDAEVAEKCFFILLFADPE